MLRSTKCFFVLAFVVVTFQIKIVNSFLLDPTVLRDKLDTLAKDGLGVQEMQAYLDTLQFDERIINGSQTILDLKSKLADKFHARIQAASRLKTAVEASYALPTKPADNQQCCTVDGTTLEYDARYRRPVKTSEFCTRAAIGGTIPRQLDVAVKDAMEDNIKASPYLKWQYFGSYDGLTTIYPMHSLTEGECGSYDNRYRPWYVATATPKPKNIVIVMDVSGSMTEKHYGSGKTWHSLATEAGTTVLDTMNARDKVGVVLLATEARTAGNADTTMCYDNQLAEANSVNVAKLKTFLANAEAGGFTMYGPALTKAFTLLNNSKPLSDEDRDHVILFLTDGTPTDLKESIMKIIVDSNKDLGNKVIIMAYGIGSGNFSFLGDMVNQTGYNHAWDPSAGQVMPGRFMQITDISRLKDEMATYYEFFAISGNSSIAEPIIAVPYYDAWGLGLITTVSLPCYHGNKFIGVVGIDITMADLLADVTYFGSGQDSYAFMIDGSGWTMMHPLLEMPSNVDEDHRSMDIRTLEPNTDKAILDSMQRGESGQSSFTTKRYLPRGSTKAGVRVEQLNATYYWEHVNGTSFSVGLVVVHDDRPAMLRTLTPSDTFNFVYHRLDLLKPDSPCTQFNRYAVKGSSIVKFSADAFIDPYRYIGMPETSSLVMKYFMYIIDQTGTIPNPGIRAGVKDHVIASQKAEDIWLKSKTDLNQYVVWRYVGSSRGTMRLIPGVALDKSYDPTKRPWYHGAMDTPSNNTLSTPYIDAFGAGLVITLSHTLSKGAAQADVFGVMGVDFTLRYFHRLITDTYPKCTDVSKYKCFIMDSSGFFVMHEDFLSPDITAKTLEDVHITQKLGSVAFDMMAQGILVQKYCRNFVEIGKQLFYEVHLTASRSSEINSTTCKMYEVHPIGNSNVYLGILEGIGDSVCPSEDCDCPTTNKCTPSPSSCKCPCLSHLQYEYCDNSFPQSSVPICAVPPVVVSSTPIVEDIRGLERCYPSLCGKKTSFVACYGVVECSWCIVDEKGVPYTKPFCIDQNLCYGGRYGNPVPGAPTDPPRNPAPQTDDLLIQSIMIAGCAVGGVVMVTLAYFVIRKCLSRRRERPDDDITYNAGNMTAPYPPMAPEQTIYANMYDVTPQGPQQDFLYEQSSFDQEDYPSGQAEYPGHAIYESAGHPVPVPYDYDDQHYDTTIYGHVR